MNGKYEFTEETKIWCSTVLHRIRALKDFNDVSKGDLGGWIEKEENLSADGNAWVYDNARVYGGAWVCDGAQVCGDARVCDNHSVLWISNIGSRYDTTTFFKCEDREIRVKCGCFYGTLGAFAEKVEETHGEDTYGAEYRLAIELAKVHLKVGSEQDE